MLVKNLFSFKCMKRQTAGILFVLLIGFYPHGFARQKQDSTLIEKAGANKTVKKIQGLITRDPKTDRSLFHVKSEASYIPYEGKIIRKIDIKRIGFERILPDTSQVVMSFVANTANHLHTNTRESVIRNNLFVREGQPLNPYRVADNERTIRNLDFMMDARIYVKPISNSKDSVDLLVVTRDVFSWGGSVRATLPNQYILGVKNINVNGHGQRIEFKQLFDTKRTPQYGYEVLYRLTNIQGSFIDATIAYTRLNNGISVGNENERAVYFKLNRDLYQPFARVAGAIELSDNVSKNVYNESDEEFVDYHYKIQDYWMGYSFGYRKMPNNLKENRNRKFISLRVAEQRFVNPTYTNLTEPDGFVYRDRLTVLSQLTLFRQDFYKTQYVLGFGRTEDVPYGYRISFTGGAERESGGERLYAGSEFYHNKVLKSGTILTYIFSVGTYWVHGHTEDDLLAVKFIRYSKIRHMGRSIVRHQLEAGYAALFNQHIKRGLTIRDKEGIIGFLPDSLVGLQRVILSGETTVFTPWKLLGFRMAPLARIDIALLKTGDGLFRSRNLFAGFSAGLRVRNENLIFNTVEARLFYYPNTVEDIGHFKFTVTSNLRIRYPTNLVKKPTTAFR